MVKAGQRARDTNVLVCRECRKETPVHRGETIPRCLCGAGDFHNRGAGAGRFRRGSASGNRPERN